jgi:hypothetical protein
MAVLRDEGSTHHFNKPPARFKFAYAADKTVYFLGIDFDNEKLDMARNFKMKNRLLRPFY